MCLLEPKEEVVKLQRFNVWYLPIEAFPHSASKKSQKVLVTVVYFFVYFAVLSLGWIKIKFRGPAIPWSEPLTTKKARITMELYGKNNWFTVPINYQKQVENNSDSLDKDWIHSSDNTVHLSHKWCQLGWAYTHTGSTILVLYLLKKYRKPGECFTWTSCHAKFASR